MSRSAWLILWNQLFPARLLGDVKLVFMLEDEALFRRYPYHKQKLVFVIAAMRRYAQELRDQGFTVVYRDLEDPAGTNFEEALRAFLAEHQVDRLHHFEVEERIQEVQLRDFAEGRGLSLQEHQSPMFMTSRVRFQEFVKGRKRPMMKNFYEQQRRTFNILMDGDQPRGGRWSFDTENRKKLPAKQMVPDIPRLGGSVDAERELVASRFADHPGALDCFIWPVTREDSEKWLQHFLEYRLALFGPYEDALTHRHDYVFHSVLTPMLNVGLLLPDQIVDAALDYAKRSPVPIASLEGFVRQVIGWREFIRGIYQNFDDRQQAGNFFNHNRKLSKVWWEGGSGIPMLDDMIRKVNRLGWAHHIERLMVAGNLMLLCQIHPREVYHWFMCMFIDGADWVMGPNVLGMSQFADGGIFATKPYICGANYLLKMSDYKKGDWTLGVDGLFWNFIEQKRDFFLSNPRMGMMVRQRDKIAPERWTRLMDAGEDLISRLSH